MQRATSKSATLKCAAAAAFVAVVQLSSINQPLRTASIWMYSIYRSQNANHNSLARAVVCVCDGRTVNPKAFNRH